MSRFLIISIKMLGKKHPALERKAYELPNNFPETPTLRDLLRFLVTQQVEQFNAGRTNENLLPYLTQSSVTEQAQTGKVGFGAIYNNQTVLLEDAIHTALQAFEDGLYFVFIDKNKIEGLDDNIELNQNSELMLLRLTALVGAY